jgi:hypothetical protein
VAATPRFETKATVAADKAGRVWVAWEAGGANWGKDQGYIIRDRRVGVPIGGAREPRIRCLDNGQWREPKQALAAVFRDATNTYQPHVFSDGAGSVYVMARTRYQRPNPQGTGQRGYWEYRLTRLEGEGWRAAAAIPNSRGRSSTRERALVTDGALWLAWDTDNRTGRSITGRSGSRCTLALVPAAAITVALAALAQPSERKRRRVTLMKPATCARSAATRRRSAGSRCGSFAATSTATRN